MKWMTKLVVLVALLGLAAGCGGDKKEGEKKEGEKKEKKAEPEKAKAEAEKVAAEAEKVAVEAEKVAATAAEEHVKVAVESAGEVEAEKIAVDAAAEKAEMEKAAEPVEPPKPSPVEKIAEGGGSGLTAEKTVTTFTGYLVAGDVKGIWGLLPPSYRADLIAVVRVVTSEMDKEIFEAMVTVIDRIMVAVEKNKDKLVQQVAAFAGPEAPAKDIAMGVDGILDAWKAIKVAGFDKYETFAAFDLNKFINEQGGGVAAGLIAMAKASGNPEVGEFFKLAEGLKVETIEETADKAKLKIIFGDETEEGELVKVEGHWIPDDMASDWDDVKGAAAEAREGMAELKKSKVEILASLKQIEPVLAQFEASGDLMAVMGAMGGGMAPPPTGGGEMAPPPVPEAPEVKAAPEAAPAPAAEAPAEAKAPEAAPAAPEK